VLVLGSVGPGVCYFRSSGVESGEGFRLKGIYFHETEFGRKLCLFCVRWHIVKGFRKLLKGAPRCWGVESRGSTVGIQL